MTLNNNDTVEHRTTEDDEKFKPKIGCTSYLPAVLNVLLVSTVPLVAGYAIGFSSPAAKSLEQEDEYGLRLDAEQQTWFGSVIMLAALVGSIGAAPCTETFGRKPTIIATLCLYLVGWMVLFMAKDVFTLFAGRILLGIAFGASITVIPLYLGEIGPAAIRGLVGTLFNFWLSIGVVVAFVSGVYVEWRPLAQIAGSLTCVAILCCAIIPESPYWLLGRGDEKGAVTSLKRLYRGSGSHHTIQRIVTEFWNAPKLPKAEISIECIRRREFFQPIFIVICLHALQHLTGINVIIFYAHSIFSTAGFRNEHLPSLLVAGVQSVTMIFTMQLVECLGRKKSLIISSLGAAACLTSLGSCMLVLRKHSDVHLQVLNSSAEVVSAERFDSVPAAAWISMLSTLGFIAFFAIGLGPVAYLALGEILPLQYRGIGSSIATSVNGISAFFVIKTFRFLENAIHIYGVFWAFAVASLMSAAFVWRCFPETKGKSLVEIEAFFSDAGKSERISGDCECKESIDC